MKYAELLQQARPVFDREDCCPVGAVMIASGSYPSPENGDPYPGLGTICEVERTHLGGLAASGWWEIVKAWDDAFGEDEDLLPKSVGFAAALAEAREIDAREMR